MNNLKKKSTMKKTLSTLVLLASCVIGLGACNTEKDYEEMSKQVESAEKEEQKKEEPDVTEHVSEKEENKDIPSTPYPLEVQMDIEKELSNGKSDYKIGEDCQYPYMKEGGAQIAKTENGYYCLNNNFIYYIDGKTMKANPICSRSDCLHAKEKSEERRKKCDAYTTSNQIQYYDGNLYIEEEQLLEEVKGVETFYRLSADGTRKEKIFQIKNVNLSGWAVHRGYLYFTTAQYIPEKNEIDPGETQTYCRVNRIPVTGAKKEEVLYECKEVKYNGEIYTPVLYGNHLYVEVFGTYEDRAAADAEDRKKICFEKMLQYNIEDGTHTYIEADKESVVAQVHFFRGKLLFYGYHFEYDDKRNCQYYIADLDGSNVKKIFKTKNPWDRYITDGKYLYCDNYFGIFYSQIEGKMDSPKSQYFQVYDMNLNGIDVVGLPKDNQDLYYLPAEDEKYFFCMPDFLQQDETEIEDIICFDKQEIGRVKGSIWKKKSISILGE